LKASTVFHLQILQKR